MISLSHVTFAFFCLSVGAAYPIFSQSIRVTATDLYAEMSMPMALTRTPFEANTLKTQAENGQVQAYIDSAVSKIEKKSFRSAIKLLNLAAKAQPDFCMSYYFLGIAYQRLRFLDSARILLQKSIKVASWHADSHLALGVIHQQYGAYSMAMVEYDKAIQNSPRMLQAYYNKGTIAMSRGEGNRAIGFYKHCVEIDPSAPDAYCAQGLAAFFVLNNVGEAEKYLTQAIQAHPDYSPAYFWRGFVLREKNRDQWLADWDKASKLEPSSPFLNISRGIQLMEFDRYDDAIDCWNRSLDRFEGNHYVGAQTLLDRQIDLKGALKYLVSHRFDISPSSFSELERSFCQLVTGRSKEALRSVQQAAREPSSTAYFIEGLVYERMLKHDSAFMFYDLSLQADKDNFEAYKKRGMYRAVMQDFKGAYQDFDQMERIDPNSYFTFRLRGAIKLYQKNYVGAILDLTEFLKFDSTDVDVLDFRGRARRALGDYNGSCEDFFKVLERRRGSPETHKLLSENYLQLKDTANAIYYMVKYVSLSAPMGKSFAAMGNTTMYTRTFQAREELAKLYITVNDWANAEKQIDSIKMKLWSSNPSNRKEYAQVYRLQGLLSFAQNDFSLAIKNFSSSSEKDPTNFGVKYLLAQSYEKAGQIRKARDEFKAINGYADAEANYLRLEVEMKKPKR